MTQSESSDHTPYVSKLQRRRAAARRVRDLEERRRAIARHARELAEDSSGKSVTDLPDTPEQDEHFKMPMRPEQTFQLHLRTLRARLGWSQQKLASEMGKRGRSWYQSTVAAVERGERQVGLGEALDVADCFGVPPARMWTDPGPIHGSEEESELRRKAADLEIRLAAVGQRVEEANSQRDQAIAVLTTAQIEKSVLSNQLRDVWRQIEQAEGQVHLPGWKGFPEDQE